MSLRWRILLGLFGLALLLAGTAFYHLRLVRQLADDNRSLSDERLQAIALAVSTEREVLENRYLRRRYAVQEDARYTEFLLEQRAALDGAFDRLSRLTQGTPAEESAARAARAWAGILAADAAAGSAAPSRDTAAASEISTTSGPTPISADVASQFADITTALDDVIGGLDTSIRQQAQASSERARRASSAALLSTVVAFAVALFISAWIVRSVEQPLRSLAEGSAAIASGRFEHRIPPPSSREMALLAEDFNYMAARLGQLDEMKKDFVTGVSHDLKSPLASLRDTLELVLDGSLGELNDRQRRMLTLSRDSIGSLSAMISTLLDLARFDSGTVVFQRVRISPRELLEEALAQYRGAIDKNELTVRWQLAEAETTDEVEVEGDRVLLLRALGNIVDNAVSYSPSGGELVVSISDLPGQVQIAVEDEGPGVPSTERERIFDRFHRSPTQRRGARGTGLGLTLTRSIVEAHGGKVWMEDPQRADPTEPGAEDRPGSRFVVTLPRSSQPTAE